MAIIVLTDLRLGMEKLSTVTRSSYEPAVELDSGMPFDAWKVMG